ncbi:MAG: hypothetical protein Q8P92_01570 [Candidatus Daviesbacteria bacterium]|nr:hypothetical protein [Candidatus Daviesbacteria bacterium]
MEEKTTQSSSGRIKLMHFASENPLKLFLIVVGVTLVLGSITGYIISGNSTPGGVGELTTPKTASQDTRTFRDFAEGVIKPRPTPKDPTQYYEGTHTLEREGAVPVALTSSVVDLSKFEGKKVKVFGETQKALEAGWLMDVGKVEELE